MKHETKNFKMKFCPYKINFLGYEIQNETITSANVNVEVIKNLKSPSNINAF